MGPGNLSPLDELKSLDQQIDQIQSLAGLQPLFARLEELTKQHSGDFEVQLVAHDVKQHMLTRGSKIKQMPPPVAAPIPVPMPIPVAAPPPVTAEPPQPRIAPNEPRRSKKPLLWVFASIVVLGAITLAVNMVQQRNLKLAETTPLDATITTVPPGAEIVIEGQQSCRSDCVAKLVPGNYEIAAMLDGYEPGSASLTVKAGQPAAVSLTLAPQPVSVRIFADLGTGQVFLDDQPVGELLDGQYTIEGVKRGSHKIRVTGGTSEATFSLAAAPATMPVVDSLIQTKNLLAVVVGNLGNKARMVTSSGPMKLTVNGAEETDASPDGIELSHFKTGPGEFVLGEGNKQRTLTGTFAASPTLTAFLKTDQQIGTLIITTGEDDVRIFLNNREQQRRTAKGQARLQTFGDVTVRVEKPGFEPVPAQKATVAKGAETKLAFTMKALPRFGALSVSGAVAGTQILLNDRPLGTVGNDGAFRNTSIAPGEHTIELRRDQFEPKRFARTFRAGETVVIGVSEATLTAVRPPPPPPAPPPPKPEPPPVKPAPRVRASGTMANFDSPGAWAQSDGVWKHRGAATLTYGLQPDGIFTFSIYMLKGGSLLRGGRVRWFVNYTDAKNYCLFELDEENLWAKVVTNGKTLERKRVAHKQDKSMRVWNIQVDVNAQRVIHKIQGDDAWVELDNWSEPGRDFTVGKFGILVTGSDEVGLSNFSFTGH